MKLVITRYTNKSGKDEVNFIGDIMEVDILKDDGDGLIHASTYINLKNDHMVLEDKHAALNKMNSDLTDKINNLYKGNHALTIANEELMARVKMATTENQELRNKLSQLKNIII